MTSTSPWYQPLRPIVLGSRTCWVTTTLFAARWPCPSTVLRKKVVRMVRQWNAQFPRSAFSSCFFHSDGCPCERNIHMAGSSTRNIHGMMNKDAQAIRIRIRQVASIWNLRLFLATVQNASNTWCPTENSYSIFQTPTKNWRSTVLVNKHSNDISR